MNLNNIFDKTLDKFQTKGFSKQSILMAITTIMFFIGVCLHFYVVWMIQHPPKKRLTIEDVIHKSAGMCNKGSSKKPDVKLKSKQ